MAAAASALLSDADVGFGAPATPATPAPKLLSDADVGFSPQGAAATPSGGAPPEGAQPDATVTVHGHVPQPPDATSAFLSAVGGRPPPPPAVEDIAARVGNAVLQGYGNVPMDAVLTPMAQDWVAKVSENAPRPNLQDVLTVGHALLAGGNAVFQGGLEGVAALGDAVGQPLLGRDVAGYLEAAGRTGAPSLGGLLRPTLPETRAALTERALAPGTQATPVPEASPITPPGANTNVAGGGRATMPLGTLVDAIVNAPTIDDAIKQAAGVVEKPNIGGAGAGTIAEQADRLDSSAQAEGYTDAMDKMAQQAAGPSVPEPSVQQTGSGSQINAMLNADPTTSAGAKAVAGAYYKIADDNGGILSPEFVDKFIDGVKDAAPQTEAGAAVVGPSAISSLAGRLESLRDQPMTLQAAQEVDEGLGNLIDKEYNNGRLSKDGKNLQDIQQAFRAQILSAGPADIVGGTTGFDALGPARQAWSQAMKLDDLERIQTRADYSDNPATAIKSQLRTMLSNPARLRGYSPDEVEALQDAANRGVIGGALHVFGGRLVPLIAGAVGMAHGGPLGAIVDAGAAHAITAGMRNLAGRLQSNRLGNVSTVIGQGVPPNPLSPSSP